MATPIARSAPPPGPNAHASLKKQVQDTITEVALFAVVPAVRDHAAADPAFAQRLKDLSARSADLAFNAFKPGLDADVTGDVESPDTLVAAGMQYIDPDLFRRKVQARRRRDALRKAAGR